MLTRRTMAGLVGRARGFQARAAVPVAGAHTSPLGPSTLPTRRLFSANGKEEKTFAAKCKTVAANALLEGVLNNTTGFDSLFAGLKITDIGKGTVEMELLVEPKMQNPFWKMHGGALCTLVDLAGTAAIMSLSPTQPGVSVDLNVSFLSAADIGETLIITSKVEKLGQKLGFTNSRIIVVSKVEKLGQKLGFTDVRISEKLSGRLVAVGRHTKYFSG